MEKNKPLIKDAKPGEMSIRTSITKPDITGPIHDHEDSAGKKSRHDHPGGNEGHVHGDAPRRRPFSDD